MCVDGQLTTKKDHQDHQNHQDHHKHHQDHQASCNGLGSSWGGSRGTSGTSIAPSPEPRAFASTSRRAFWTVLDVLFLCVYF